MEDNKKICCGTCKFYDGDTNNDRAKCKVKDTFVKKDAGCYRHTKKEGK